MPTWKERELASINTQNEDSEKDFWNTWIDRTRLMRQWITDDIKSVIDLGAGGMLLKNMLPSDTIYYPVDYVSRCSETIVCDFNKKEFPDVKADCCYCGGILEYVEDADWFIEKIKETGCKKFLLSYSIKINGQTRESRSENGWVNDFSFLELLDLIYSKGFILVDWNKHYDFSPILLFVPASSMSLQNNYFCVGCGACKNICNQNAINLSPDKYGFLKPILNSSICINCNKCISVCPVLHKKSITSFNSHVFMGMANDEERQLSSSGGAFSIIARYILSKNGVIFGVAWDKDFSVKHIAIESAADLSFLQKSKYLQSKIDDTYILAKTELDKNRFVLFSGTPCQIQGFKLFLGKDYKNLITIDILCHYVPSPKIFHQYLSENFGIENIKSFSFRDKERGWSFDLQKIIKKDNSIEYRDYNNDFFQKGFHSRLFMNEACENCKFADFPRVGDITLGDFWGIKDNEKYNDGKGSSEIIVNTQKGLDLINSIKEKFIRLEELQIETTYTNRIKQQYYIHPEQKHFLTLLQNNSFNSSVEHAIERKFQIGLVGDWAVENYGANITYFALYKVLTDLLGYDVLLIERPSNASWPPKEPPTCFMNLPYPKYAIEPYKDKISMKQLNYRCEKFLVGSDQCFNNHLYYLFGEFITLDWIHDNKLKIAYAASFGNDRINGNDYDRAKLSLFMKKFDAFSVREKSAITLAKKEFDIDATHVLDPVFLCPREEFINLAKIGGYYEYEKDNYLFSYILDVNEPILKSLKNTSNILNIPYKVLTDISKNQKEYNFNFNDKTEIVYSSNVENWLANIICCKYLITDSYHGMCLAIIFHKPFIAIVNKTRGAARFYSILDDLNLLHRLVENPSEILKKNIHEEINWNDVDKKLKKLKEESFDWLKKSLKKNKKTALSEYDVTSDRIDDINIQVTNLSNQIKQNNNTMTNDFNTINNNINKLNEKIKIHTDLINGEIKVFKENVEFIENQQKVLETKVNQIVEYIKYVNNRFNTIDEYAKEVNKHIADLESQNRIQKVIQRVIRKIKRFLKKRR